MYIGTLSKLDKQPHGNLEELRQAGAKNGDQVPLAKLSYLPSDAKRLDRGCVAKGSWPLRIGESGR